MLNSYGGGSSDFPGPNFFCEHLVSFPKLPYAVSFCLLSLLYVSLEGERGPVQNMMLIKWQISVRFN